MFFKNSLFFLSLLLLFFAFNQAGAANLGETLKGRILLQVEDKGQAYYVDPLSNQRAYLGRPADAFSIMRAFGLGISNKDLDRIAEPGVGDKDKNFAGKLAGRILLQVEANGEAYYVSPVDLKKYYLGRPADAFNIMREQGLGITNKDLDTINKSPQFKDETGESTAPAPEGPIEDEAGEATAPAPEPEPEEPISEQVAPTISNIMAEVVDSHSVNISWETDMLSRGELNYGLKADKLIEGVEDSNFSLIHNIKIQDLAPGTDYYYSILASSEEGLEKNSDIKMFSTFSEPRTISQSEVINISQVFTDNAHPQTVATGDYFGLTFSDGNKISFSKINKESFSIGRFTTFVGDSESALAWNGSKFGLVWEKNCRLYFNTVDMLDKKLNADKVVVQGANSGSCPTDARIIGITDGFALSWKSNNAISGKSELYFKKITDKGLNLSTQILLADNVTDFDLSGNGENFSLAWREETATPAYYFLQLNSLGEKIDKKIKIADAATSSFPLQISLLSDGYAVSWLEENSAEEAEINVINLDFSKNIVSGKKTIISENYKGISSVSINNTDKVIAIGWKEDQAVKFLEFNVRAEKLSEVSEVSSSVDALSDINLSWNDNKYGLIWQETTGNNKIIKFITLE